MSKRDYYTVLGVSRDADESTLKKSYRKLAMQYHPDKNPGDQEAADRFREAAEAYDVLSDPEKRSRYDQFGFAGVSGSGSGFGGGGFQNMEDIFSSFGDIFGDIFGGRAGRSSQQRGPRRGADLRYMLEVDLKTCITGDEREIEFDTEQTCASCTGSGAQKGTSVATCSTCGGRGQVLRSQGFFQISTTCPTCSGQGQTIKDPCRECRGQGRVEAHRKIRVKIPKGVDNGNRLRISGEGEGGYAGGPSGDLFVEIRVEPHPNFERRASDLIGRARVDYLDAILGGEIEVDTPFEKTKIAVPAGAQPGDLLRLKGEGVPSLKSGARGDILYQVDLQIPTTLSSQEREKLQEIRESRGGASAPKKRKAGFFS